MKSVRDDEDDSGWRFTPAQHGLPDALPIWVSRTVATKLGLQPEQVREIYAESVKVMRERDRYE